MDKENENGMYIRLYDSLVEDEIWKECKPNTFKVWIGLLLKAQKYTNGEYKSGSVYESKEYLAKEIFHISTNTLDSCLQELESMKKISQETIIKFGKRYGTKITIKNWEKYQNFEPTSKVEVSGKNSKSNCYESLTSKVEDRTEVRIEDRTEVRIEDTKYNNIDSSLRSSSNYSEKEREEGKETDAASLRSAATAAAPQGVGENAFGEKYKGQVPSGQSGLYQPQPVQAPEFQMTQQPLYPSDTEDYFTLKDVYDCIVRYLPEGYKLDKAGNDFIKSMFFSVRNKAFTKQNGGIWSALDLSEWLAKLLGEKGYPVVSPVKAQPVQALNAVQPPFTFDDVLSHLNKYEWDENIEYLKERYDSFSRKGFVTSSGEKVTLSFFTGFLLDEARKATGKKKRNPGKRVPWTGWEK